MSMCDVERMHDFHFWELGRVKHARKQGRTARAKGNGRLIGEARMGRSVQGGIFKSALGSPI